MKRTLTTWEAACIVVGNGIGGGMMAAPYLMERAGAAAGIAVLLLAWAASAALHLMVADMLIEEDYGLTILPIFRRFLFRGRRRKALTGGFFAVLCVVLVANLAAYVAGGADILASLLPIPEWVAGIAFYVASLLVPLFGLKAVGVSEKVGGAAMIAAVALLSGLSLIRGRQPVPWQPRGAAPVLALFGGVMFCLSALFAVPQAVGGLGGDRRKIRLAVAGGLGLNALLTAVVAFAAIRASETVTTVAIIGWSASLGEGVRIIASLFILLAMLTSFWAVSLALGEMAAHQTGLKGMLGFMAVTLPSLLLTFVGGAGFLSFVGAAGGAVAIIVALLLLPAYRNARRESARPSLLGRAGDSRVFSLAVGLGYLLMAAGSLINV